MSCACLNCDEGLCQVRHPFCKECTKARKLPGGPDDYPTTRWATTFHIQEGNWDGSYDNAVRAREAG